MLQKENNLRNKHEIRAKIKSPKNQNCNKAATTN